MRWVLMLCLSSWAADAQPKPAKPARLKSAPLVRGTASNPAPASREVVIVQGDDEAQRWALAARQAEPDAKEKALEAREKALEEGRQTRAAAQAKAIKHLERQADENAVMLERAAEALSGQ